MGTSIHMVDTLPDLNATDSSHSIIIAACSSLHEYLVSLTYTGRANVEDESERNRPALEYFIRVSYRKREGGSLGILTVMGCKIINF